MYSEELREAAVSKLLMPGGPTIAEVAAETGVGESTLWAWKKKYGKTLLMGKNSKSTRQWSHAEKVTALIETHGLSEKELGLYFREHGFTSVDLERWKKEFVEDNPGEKDKRGRPALASEVKELRKQNKKLAKDLRRKEKALAEASALLVLKKKAELIWGTSEDDESE